MVEPSRSLHAAPAPPCILVVFGATGDLTHRLLMPALYNLACAGLLPEEFAVVGVAHNDQDTETFRRDLTKTTREFVAAPFADDRWRWLCDRIFYMRGEFAAAETYDRLAHLLEEVATARHTGGNVVFYLATPPNFFGAIVARLGAARLTEETDSQWRRIIIEKPFGTDLSSAQALNDAVLAVVPETQIYRIDHYLGKETVQNIMVLRFANGLFEPLWNRDHIDHVQLTVAETVGVEQRGKFYDAVGALRDMIPNHLFQVLSLTAMEPPTCFDADAVRLEKTKVLEAIHCFAADNVHETVARAQYVAGAVEGRPVDAYRDAPNVDPQSTTETYVAMRMTIDNWRWAGVPFYLRTGKAMKRRRTEVVIQFKPAPLTLFRDTPVEQLVQNDLVLRLVPDEGASLRFGAKLPGPSLRIGGVDMTFNYKDYFKEAPSTGYETLIYDCMIGDATLFKNAKNIEAGWRVVQPVLDAWAKDRVTQLPTYAAGSAGPDEAEALLARDGRRWRALE